MARNTHKRFALLVAMGYSRQMWLQFYPRQTFTVLMRGLEESFAAFGGVPAKLLFDQMKAVVIEDRREVGGKLLENIEFVRFTTHWGFRIRACRLSRAHHRCSRRRRLSRPLRRCGRLHVLHCPESWLRPRIGLSHRQCPCGLSTEWNLPRSARSTHPLDRRQGTGDRRVRFRSGSCVPLAQKADP